MTEPAGTPAADPKASVTPTSEPAKDDSAQVTVSAQFKKEALENWKPAAERANKLEADLAAERAKVEQLSRLAYSGGQQATDPRAELIAKLQEQAQYDPVAQATLINMQETAVSRAESWLASQLVSVPEAKRAMVSEYIRSKGYQVGASDALNALSDPETKTLAEQLHALQQENERLKNAKPNGVSPASVTPATASADEGRTTEEIERSEYVATLNAARAPGASAELQRRAKDLMQAVGSNKTRLK